MSRFSEKQGRERKPAWRRRHSDVASLHRDLEEQTAKGFAETRARFADTLQFINRLDT
jgi:hypothetical protein